MSLSIAPLHVLESEGSSERPVRRGARALPVPPSRQLLRRTAMRLDGANGTTSRATADPVTFWEAVVRGRWTLIDWFDTDGRRFIIVKRNTPRPGGPRGLTTRERQVVLCAAMGESSKATGYRLGVSPSRVSALLNAAMRKLGVRTKAQLVVMVRLLSLHNA